MKFKRVLLQKRPCCHGKKEEMEYQNVQYEMLLSKLTRNTHAMNRMDIASKEISKLGWPKSSPGFWPTQRIRIQRNNEMKSEQR